MSRPLRPCLWPKIAAVCALTVLSAPGPARACGPGVHAREALAALAQLVEIDPTWGARAQVPYAQAYLVMGSVAPDVQNVLSSVGFGHNMSLSMHLLEAAEAEGSPEHALFALGHLMHAGASDPLCETFMTPLVMSMVPLGMIDLFADLDDAKGEPEGLAEVYGDMILGDWDAVVDAAFDLLLGSEEARARFMELLRWYCARANEVLNTPVDCALVEAEFVEMLVPAEDLIGGMDRAQVHALLDAVLAKPPEELLSFIFDSGVIEMYGAGFAPSAIFDRELARVLESPLGDPTFWLLYDDLLAEHGPRWGVERALTGVAGWPSYDEPAMICGNIQSVLASMPERYEVTPGLLLDRLRFLDEAREVVESITSANEGHALRAELRLFSALPLEGTIRGVVRRDLPGLDTSADEVVGEATVAVSIDPLLYVQEKRVTLEIPFTAQTEGARGFYVELYLDDGPLPWMTTSWDRIWVESPLEVDQRVYRDNFDTYGHFPASLPVEDGPADPPALFVSAHLAPHGRGLAGVSVVFGDESEATTSSNGIARFWEPTPGEHALSVEASGYTILAPVTTQVVEEGITWERVDLHALPMLEVDRAFVSSDCVAIHVDPAPFEEQLARFHVTAVALEAGMPAVEELTIGKNGDGEVCGLSALADGEAARLEVTAEYTDGSLGAPSAEVEVVYDGSPPVAYAAVVTSTDGRVCVRDSDAWIAVVTLRVREPHSALTEVTWSDDGDEWTRLEDATFEASEDGSGDWHIRLERGLDALGERMGWLQVRNAAGGLSEALAIDAPWLCEPYDTWEPAEDIEETGDDAEPPLDVIDARPETSDSAGSGCSSTPDGERTPLTSLLSLLLIGLALLRSHRGPGTAARGR
jgi:hypothetical protein